MFGGDSPPCKWSLCCFSTEEVPPPRVASAGAQAFLPVAPLSAGGGGKPFVERGGEPMRGCGFLDRPIMKRPGTKDLSDPPAGPGGNYGNPPAQGNCFGATGPSAQRNCFGATSPPLWELCFGATGLPLWERRFGAMDPRGREWCFGNPG